MALLADASSLPPWWAVPVVAGVFAVGGVVLAQVVSLRLDSRRARREEAIRWHAERRRVYAAYAAKVNRQIVEIGLKLDGLDISWSVLSDFLEEVDTARIEVDLIATKPVREAADALWKGLGKGGDQAMSGGEDNDLTSDAFLRDTRSLLNAFLRAAREELGV